MQPILVIQKTTKPNALELQVPVTIHSGSKAGVAPGDNAAAAHVLAKKIF